MEISISEALNRNDLLFIDVRSPREYAEASIPGAINIPIFDDEEHRQLGIIYHQFGKREARFKALEMVSPRLPDLTNEIIKASNKKIPLLYCQRGGMRSLSLYQVLSLTGIKVFRLHGGYKAFRNHVNKRLASYNLDDKIIYVLHGLTGTGKTQVLEELASLNIPVINIEKLARHRGSVFGNVGLDQPRSQKDFDALLLQLLDENHNSSFFVTEGEGRRIGNIYLPYFISRAMQEGCHLLLTASLETRVTRIVETYTHSNIIQNGIVEQLKEGILSLKNRIGYKKAKQLTTMLDKGDYYAAAEKLCAEYYDQFYADAKTEHSHFNDIINAENISSAVRQVAKIINRDHPLPGMPLVNGELKV